MILLVLWFFIFHMSLDSRYIKPYKNLALELSRPYSYTRNIKFKLTFSVTQINIPPSAYMILNFNFLELFNDKDIGSPLNCKMSLYREKIGASFDPLIDLDSEIDNLNINYISQCSSAPNPPFYYFQLNHTLSFLQLYQLSFQMNAEMVKFSTGLSISFVSNINLLDSNYIYCSNLLYGILLIQDLPDTYHNISFKSQKKYFSDAFYQIINVALSQTLLTYSQALMSLKDISISSFNSMIENSVFSGIEFFDNHVYPDNIMNFPGFFGNLVLEIFLNETANSFLLWELNVPIGWNLEESNCISTNFFKNGKINIAIAHTKCTIEKNQMIKFYNIENIEANTWIRINITSVRNPIVPMNGTAKFNIFNEKIRKIQYQNRYLSGLEVQQQKNNNLKVEFYSTDSSFTGNLNLFANRTQRLAIKISIPYYDLIGETKIVIQQNNINIDYGFSLGTCVIKNSEDALIPITDARKIQCIIEKSKITLKNIGRIKANKYFEIYILNKNEGTSGFLSFQIDIYGIDLTQQSFANISSYSYNKTINLTLDTSLLIQDIFYQINNNNSQVFDISEVHSADKPIFIVNFTFTKTIKKNNIGDRVILLLNKWISISVQDLNCEIDSKIISCTHQNNYEDISVISLNIDNFALNLFNNHSHILKISGLSYTRICFNSYLFAFEYFLAYKSINDSIILSMKTAHINPILKETAAEDQILLIGQGIKPQVFYSFLKVKFSSSIIHHFLENLKPNSLLVRIYHQNLNNTHYKNFVSADVTTNSHINAEFIKGVNESSLDYLDWDFYELSNISINNLNDYAEITLEMTFSPPIFNIDYYFTTTIYKIPILYDLFQKKIQTNTKFIKPDKLILDWNASRILNKGKLILRQPIFFSFSLNLSSEIIAPLILRHSGYLVFIFPWLILNDNILPLNCSFLKKSIFFSINVKKILDKFSKNSALLMKLDDLDIYNDYFEPLENSIICSNLMPPEGLNFKEADGLVLDSQGVIISRNSMKFKSEDFDSGVLNLKRLLVTPNNVNFPAAHYAAFLMNENFIAKKDYIGINLPRIYYPDSILDDILCYISFMPQDYEIPEKGAAFNFDDYEYDEGYTQKINPFTTNILRLKTKGCNTISEKNSSSIDKNDNTIVMQLQLFDQIPPGSLLLFEIFGIKNPSITHALILFQIYSIKKGNEPELIMTSSRNYIHYFLNYEVNYNNSIETELYNINPFHVNGLHHPPSIFEITLNELILPNFLLYITPSKNIKDFIYNNSNLKVYADVTNENTKISSIQDLELIQRQEDYIENDNQSSSKQDLKENLFTKPKIYKIPIVRTFSSNHESINLTIGRPSLSQRTLKITFYNYLLPDDDDEFCLTLDIMVKFNILIKKTACTKFLKGVSANLLFKILKTDIRVESIRSNMSIELNPNFTIDGIINYIGIFFDESITIPDEINTFVNGHMVFHDIFDNIIIGYLPDLDRNKPFIFEISDFLGSLSYLNMKGSIIIMSFYKDMPAIIAQSVFSLEKTQNLATSKIKLVITDISPKTFSTFDKIPSFTMIVWVDNYQPKINHTFRVILPNDFPSDFLIPSENLQCLLEIINITIIETICQMKGTFLDLTIIENVQIIENNLEFSFKITIENLVSSPNSGNSGDFMILIYDETKKMIGTTFRSSDFYINPVIHQTLEFITKSHDLNLNVDVKLIRIKKGAIKQIYLFPKDKKGFKNDMKLSFEVIGNHDLKVMSSSIQIKSGDFFAIINISASYNASEYIAFIIFSKEESGEVKKYQEVYPLQVAIEMRNKIFIFSNETASIYAGGKSFYFYISLSDIPNIPISVILNSTQKDLVVLGSTIKDFNENKTINKFRLQLSENVDITQYYSIELKIIDSNYSNYFELYNQKITVKVFQRPINLNSYSLKFHAKVEISCKRIDIFISRLNFPIMIYYQIFKKINNNLLELSFEEIIKKNDEAIDSKINFENMILGIFYCDQTSEICSEQISGLEVIGYYIKCIGVSPAGVQAQETYSIYFEPYPIKPLVLSIGFDQGFPASYYNLILCAFVDYFGINSENLYLAVNNQTCNKTLFLASHSLANVYSKANESISKTNAYIKSIKNTLLDMDLTLNNIANLKLSLITDFVSNAASLDLIISQFTYSSVTLYLYPEDSNPNQDLLIYAKMIDNVKKISYFKAKYPFLTNQMYLKVSGMLGSKNDLQAIMPNFIGEPFIRTDDSSISLSLELSGEGIVYAIAIQAGKAEPISGDQIARGVDGSGNEANKDVKKILLDSEGNLRPVIIKFNSLENDVLYNIFYTVGIQVPRESLISSKIEKIVSMARNPKRGNKNKRILNADEEENEQKFR